MLLAGGLVLLTLVAERALFGRGSLAGGALLPAPAGASDLWAAFGRDGGTPDLAALALLATGLLGHAPWAVDALLLAGVPLAGLSAYRALRGLVVAPALRVWGALTWALLPVATGAVAQGRLDAAAGQVSVPLLMAAGYRVLAHDPRVVGWSRAWALGLGLLVAGALAPALWPAAVLLLLAPAAVLARAGRGTGRSRRALAALIAVTVPALVLLPGPAAGAVRAALDVPTSDAWRLLLLSPGGAGLPPALLVVGLPLAALAALLPDATARTAAVGWGVALTGLAYALLAPVAGLQVLAAGLLVAALTGAQGLSVGLSRSAFGWRQVTSTLVVLAAAVVPAVCAVAWTLRGADGPLHRAVPLAVPAFVQDDLQRGGGQVLVVRSVGVDAEWAVVGADGARLGRRPPRDAEQDRAVTDVLTARGSPAAATLAARDVRYVVLREALDGPLTAALDAQPGLARRPGGPPLVWELTAAPAGDVPVAAGRRSRPLLLGQLAALLGVLVLGAPGARPRRGLEPVARGVPG